MDSKLCTKCRTEKSAADFPKDSRLRSGLSSQCRACHALRFAKHYEANRQKINVASRAWRIANPERVKELQQKKNISPEEWKIRKAATRKRTEEKLPEYTRRSQEKHARRMNEDARYRELYLARRKVSVAKSLRRKKEAAAERRRIKELKTLENDIAKYRSGNIKRKRSHRKICPVLKLYPDLLAEAQIAARKSREARKPVDQQRQRVRDWKRRNPAQVSIQRYRRRLNFQNCVADLTEAQWSQIKAAYKHRCGYCHKRKPLTQDHVIPVSKGGDHTASNIIPACGPCNSRKNARLPIVVYQPHLIA